MKNVDQETDLSTVLIFEETSFININFSDTHLSIDLAIYSLDINRYTTRLRSSITERSAVNGC